MEGITRMAIEQYRKMLSAERRLDRNRKRVEELACQVPPEDLAEYVKVTTEIENRMAI